MTATDAAAGVLIVKQIIGRKELRWVEVRGIAVTVVHAKVVGQGWITLPCLRGIPVCEIHFQFRISKFILVEVALPVGAGAVQHLEAQAKGVARYLQRFIIHPEFSVGGIQVPLKPCRPVCIAVLIMDREVRVIFNFRSKQAGGIAV